MSLSSVRFISFIVLVLSTINKWELPALLLVDPPEGAGVVVADLLEDGVDWVDGSDLLPSGVLPGDRVGI